jgi:lipopolysaccharide export system permease protein
VTIINRYVARSFIVAFLAAMAVITFVISTGAIFKVTELLAMGASWAPVLKIFLYSIPYALGFAIPMSALVSSLLVFGRLSADGEITAMRACGLSLWQIVEYPLRISLTLSVICLAITSEVVPLAHFAQRTAIAQLGMESPGDLLEEGRFNQDLPGLSVYVGKKKGNSLTNVRIYDTRQANFRREILAKSGTIGTSADKTKIVLDLFDVTVDPFSEDQPGRAFCGKMSFEIENVMKERTYRKKRSDMGMLELIENSMTVKQKFPKDSEADQAIQRMSFLIEINERIVLALACFSFVFMGVPLGIKAHRKESSIGVALSLFLVFNFYLFIIIAESLVNHPALKPYLIVWLPIVISLSLGYYLIKRSH